jgi:hypothetical protein
LSGLFCDLCVPLEKYFIFLYRIRLTRAYRIRYIGSIDANNAMENEMGTAETINPAANALFWLRQVSLNRSAADIDTLHT